MFSMPWTCRLYGWRELGSPIDLPDTNCAENRSNSQSILSRPIAMATNPPSMRTIRSDTWIIWPPTLTHSWCKILRCRAYCPQARIIPRALDLEQFPVPEPAPNKRPLVVHAPSRRSLKGSEFVIKAVDALKEEGLDFDFLVIEDMPNAEALEHYRRADIIIDQLLMGWYGVLSMEAMAMGKTVIVYIRDDLTELFRERHAVGHRKSGNDHDSASQTIKDGELRREIAHRARAFVEEVHDSRVVARSAAKLYKKILKAPALADGAGLQLPNRKFSQFCKNVFDAVRHHGPRSYELKGTSRLVAAEDQVDPPKHCSKSR